MIVVGGEQWHMASLRHWKGELLPNSCFVNEYGPTECVVGTYVCVFLESEPKEWRHTAQQLAEWMNIIEHCEIAQHHGIKVMRTIGRVGRLVRRKDL